MSEPFNFTKASIESLGLPSPGQRAVYRDAKAKGLQLRVSAHGVKTFSVFRRIKGGPPERVTLGRYPQMTIEQARRKAAEINAAIEFGANPAQAKRAHKAELTFADLFADYLERHAKPNKRTWEEDVEKYQRHIENTLGRKPLSLITRGDIAGIHATLTRASKPTTANRVLALISSILGRGVEWGFLDSNPAKGIRRNVEKSRDRFLQSDELPRFFQALAEEENDTVRDYFLLSLLTGARRSNVLAMRWTDINMNEQLWRIPDTKNGTPQNVTLTAEAMVILKARRINAAPDAVYVLPGPGKTGHYVEPRKGWERIVKRAHLSEIRIHDLRRTLGSWQAKTGASLAIIGKSLNHKNHQTTAIYARLDLDPVRQSVSAATAAMFEPGGLNESNVVPLKRSQGGP